MLTNSSQKYQTGIKIGGILNGSRNVKENKERN